MKKRVISLLLASVMTVAMIVPAEAEPLINNEELVEEVEEVYEDDFVNEDEVVSEDEEVADEVIVSEDDIIVEDEIVDSEIVEDDIEDNDISQDLMLEEEPSDTEDATALGIIAEDAQEVEHIYGSSYLIKDITPESIYDYAVGHENVQEDDIAATLPSKFNLVNVLPALRNQGRYGVCWSFASMAAAEGDAIKDGADKNKVNYSEMALAYFLNKQYPVDPLGGTKGDNSRRVDGYWTQGNSTEYSSKLLANWVAPINESKAPYENMPAIEYDKKGNPTYIDPSVKVSKNLAYNSTARHLQNYYYLNKGDIALVKSHIYKKNVVTCAYTDSNKFYNNDTNAYYSVGEGTNHAVAIVGWDDNFSKSKFTAQKGKTPKGNGAWLIRNSWWESGTPKYGRDGYFWMSYYDETLADLMVFDYESANNYDNNYQYDGVTSSQQVVGESKLKIANVFEAKASKNGEILKAVSFVARNTNVDYTIEIYLNPTGSKPDSGIKITKATTKGTTKEQGYRTVKLKKPVELAYGDKYAIVITLEKPGYVVQSDIEVNWLVDYPDYWYESTIAIGKNQSYVDSNRGYGWTDLYKIRENGKYGNVRIKGFTDCSTKKIYRVKYKLGGGKNASANPNTYKKSNNTITLKDATRKGYVFKGWYTDSKYTKRIKTIAAGTHKNLTLYAKWDPVSYIFRYDANGGTGKMAPMHVKYNQNIVLRNSNFSRAGYVFVGWSFSKRMADVGGVQFRSGDKLVGLTSKPGDVITIYASWKKVN